MSVGTPDDQSILAPDVDATAPGDARRSRRAVPEHRENGAALGAVRARSVGVTILSVLALLYTLYFARDFLLPIVIAVLLDFLFSPVVRALHALAHRRAARRRGRRRSG